jgi:KaiC/GvpD/RAD55 family RecA-like ATPase
MGLHFIFHGAHQGEPGVIASLQENTTQLQRIAAGFGWSLDEPHVEVMYRSPVDIYIDEWAHDLKQAVERTGARQVLVDSLADLRMAAADETRFREFVYSLVQRFSRLGVSIMMTFEVQDLFQPHVCRTLPFSSVRQHSVAQLCPRAGLDQSSHVSHQIPRKPPRARHPSVPDRP